MRPGQPVTFGLTATAQFGRYCRSVRRRSRRGCPGAAADACADPVFLVRPGGVRRTRATPGLPHLFMWARDFGDSSSARWGSPSRRPAEVPAPRPCRSPGRSLGGLPAVWLAVLSAPAYAHRRESRPDGAIGGLERLDPTFFFGRPDNTKLTNGRGRRPRAASLHLGCQAVFGAAAREWGSGCPGRFWSLPGPRNGLPAVAGSILAIASRGPGERMVKIGKYLILLADSPMTFWYGLEGRIWRLWTQTPARSPPGFGWRRPGVDKLGVPSAPCLAARLAAEGATVRRGSRLPKDEILRVRVTPSDLDGLGSTPRPRRRP